MEKFTPFYHSNWDEVIEPIADHICRTPYDVDRLGRLCLFKMLNTQRAVVFLGAGVSAGYGYPKWKELCRDVADEVVKQAKDPEDPRVTMIKKMLDLDDTINQVDNIALMTACSAIEIRRPYFEEIIREVVANSANATDAVDVISELKTRLNLRRWITLNYDDTLLNNLNDNGYHPAGGLDSNSTHLILENARGKKARIITPTLDSLPDLMEMGSGNRQFSHDILHLHGRQAVSNSMIITAEQYRDRYVGDSQQRTGYRDGYEYYIASNPILFVGVSLQEEDLLRPLRRRLADKSRDNYPPVVALMPALFSSKARSGKNLKKDAARLAMDALARYQKYRIYTIYYGADLFGEERFGLKSRRHYAGSASLQISDRSVLHYQSEAKDISQRLMSEIRFIEKKQQEWWGDWSQEVPARPTNLFLISDDFKLYGRHIAYSQHFASYLKKADFDAMKESVASAGEDFSDLDRQQLSKAADICTEHLAKIIGEVSKDADSLGWDIESKGLNGFIETAWEIAKSYDAANLQTVVRCPKGSGKGTFIQQMLAFWPVWNEIHDKFSKKYASALFVSSAFSNDIESIVISISSWVDQTILNERCAKPVEISEAIQKIAALEPSARDEDGNFLLVISNCDRFFPGGKACNPLLESLFAALKEQRRIRVLIFTSENLQIADGARVVDLDGGKRRDLRIALNFSNFIPNLAQPNKLDAAYQKFTHILEHIGERSYPAIILFHALRKRNENAASLKELMEDLKFLEMQTSVLTRAPAQEYVIDWSIRAMVRTLNSSKDIQNKSKATICLNILSNIALIGIPVAHQALLACPKTNQEIENVIGNSGSKKGTKPSSSREKEIIKSLQKLVDARLVFPLFVGSQTESQFALHRDVKRVVLSRYTANSRFEGESTFFAPMLYAMEPKDNPNLDEHNYGRIIEYMKHLCETYPRLEKKESVRIRIRCVRAAFGLARTISSIGTLSRIRKLPNVGTNRIGILDDHAARIRDIYDRARSSSKLADNHKLQRPFFAHELSWLLNERGTIFLARGSLYDASTCLLQAVKPKDITAAKDVSKENFAVNWMRINYGAVCIDRGHLPRAGRIFRSICQEDEQESSQGHEKHSYLSNDNSLLKIKGDSTSQTLAFAYITLIQHIFGDLTPAKEGYIRAIDELARMARPRSLAYFRMHQGNLARTMGDFELSEQCFRLALFDAERAKQHDLVHRIRISRTRLWIDQGKGEMAEINGTIEHAKKFAGRMSMDTLYVEASTLKASAAILNGNLEVAEKNTLKAMSVATRNGMKLRKFACQLQEGEIRLLKGDADTASKIIRTVTDQARHFGYNILIQKANKLILQLGIDNA